MIGDRFTLSNAGQTDESATGLRGRRRDTEKTGQDRRFAAPTGGCGLREPLRPRANGIASTPPAGVTSNKHHTARRQP
jgi:hypothetical protein